MSAARAARAYWVTRPGTGVLRSEVVPAMPGIGRSLLRAEVSVVSPGTERLVGLGRVPARCHAAMACLGMAGSFALPVKYGYALVGIGEAGALAGRRCFVMHPHQDLVEVDDRHAVPLPDALPSARAGLFANLETAVNAVWDAELTAGERVLVVGAGVVGLLTAFAAHRLRGAEPTVVEADPDRATAAARLSFVRAALRPAQVEGGSCDVAFHASGAGAGLQLAIDALAFEGRVVDLSWYGATAVTLDLGSSFHHQRKRLLASQVGTVAPSRRGPHGQRERAAVVLSLLADPSLDALLAPPVPFPSLPEFMQALYAGAVVAGAPVVSYRT